MDFLSANSRFAVQNDGTRITRDTCKTKFCQRHIKVTVEHYLLLMFSSPKINWVVSFICLHLLPVFYLIQPSSKQIICFDIRKQNSVLPLVFYVPWFCPCVPFRTRTSHRSIFFAEFSLSKKWVEIETLCRLEIERN